MTPELATRVILIQPSAEEVIAQNMLDFRDYLDGYGLFLQCQPIEFCENDHARRGYRDAATWGCDADTEAYLAKHPVEIINVDW